MGLFKLIRPLNLAFLGISLLLVHYFLMAALAIDSLLPTAVFLTFLFSSLLMTAGGYVINDYFDIETDTINKPKRLLTTASSRQIKKAYYLGMILLLASVLLGFALGYFVGRLSFGFSYLFAAMALLVYSQKLKKQMLLGNIMVSLLTAYPYFLLFFLLLIDQNGQANVLLHQVFLFLMIMSFLLNWIREIIKDLEDMNGDYATDHATLPLQIGRKRTHFFIQTLIGITIIVLEGYSLYFFRSYWLVLFFGIGVVLPLIYTAYHFRKVLIFNNYKQQTSILKLIMLIGLLLLTFLPQILKL